MSNEIPEEMDAEEEVEHPNIIEITEKTIEESPELSQGLAMGY